MPWRMDDSENGDFEPPIIGWFGKDVIERISENETKSIRVQCIQYILPLEIPTFDAFGEKKRKGGWLTERILKRSNQM